MRSARHRVRRFSGLRAGLTLALIGLAALGPAACTRRESRSPEKILRVSQRNEPATLDPQVASIPDEFLVLRALDEGLVLPAPDGPGAGSAAVLPGAAVRWETSADGLQWTFHLRSAARWSNGDPVTAGDFVYTIRRALSPALADPKAPLFFALRNAGAYYRGAVADFARVGAFARDDHTLVLTLEHPVPHLLALAASGPWLPVHQATVEKFGPTRESAWTRPGNFVGNGPFVLAEWRPHDVIVVRRNPLYHAPGRVHLDAIRFQIYDDENTEERAFRAGQVDVTMTVPLSRISAYAAPVRRTQPLAETRYLALNVRRPPLNDPRVRRALALALDLPALVRAALKGGQEPATGFIPPGLGGYQSARIPPAGALDRPAAEATPDAPPEVHAENAAEARRLLAAAGFPGGRGFPKLELSTWTNVPVLEVVQEMWRRELGVEVSLVRREAKVHVAALRAGDYAIGFLPAIPDYGDPAALFGDFTTGAPDNFPQWSNPRYDALVAEAAQTADRAHRLPLEQKAEEILLADHPIVPLYFNAQTYLVAPRVVGWREDGLWNRFYLDVDLRE